jgi:hypothetical protein
MLASSRRPNFSFQGISLPLRSPHFAPSSAPRYERSVNESKSELRHVGYNEWRGASGRL